MSERVCKFTKNDLKQIMYFTMCKFKLDELHRQGTSSRRDHLGGFLDRWVNRAAEYVVLNNILKNRNYDFRVVPDFFLYNQETEKNAPDVLGLIDTEGEPIVRFSKFVNGEWYMEEGMPFLEIKAIRNDQKLAGVRDTQMDDEYFYLLIEADVKSDYLAAVFEDEVYDEGLMEELQMPKEFFVDKDEEENILEPIEVEKPEDIGEFRLLGIYQGDEFKEYSEELGEGEDAYYLSGVVEKDRVTASNADEEIQDGFFHYEKADVQYLPFHIKKNPGADVRLVKRNKGSCYIESDGGFRVNEFEQGDGIFKLDFSRFERSSSWTEWTGYKSTFNTQVNDYYDEAPEDRTEELLDRLESAVD